MVIRNQNNPNPNGILMLLMGEIALMGPIECLSVSAPAAHLLLGKKTR